VTLTSEETLENDGLSHVETQLRDTLSLRRRPVAVAFPEAPPTGVPKFSGTEAIPRRALVKLAADAPMVAAANAARFDYHSARRRALATE
jgi:hypothetical protein